ncbi:Biotin synthase [Labeo rohita]|uniref:Biotin synthase n=1 Tax=Labeo rohita TaxID=84645 RepID=A0ABQ8MPN0_LABRO|nr:Biotin synthase [Labeo rohita]
METASPIALTSVKRGKSSSPLRQHPCLEFGPVNSHIVLRTRPEYVPTVTTTPFRDQDSRRGRLAQKKDLSPACGCDLYGLPGQRLTLPTGNENPLDQGHRCLGSSCEWGLVNRHLQSCRLGYT